MEEEMSNDVDLSFLSEEQRTAKEFSFEVLPEGAYVAQIIGAEAKISKNGARYLLLKTQVLATEEGDEVDNKIIFHNLNLWHQDPKVASRANTDLRAIAHAVDVAIFERASDLFYRPCIVKVKVRTQEGYEATNEVKGWKRLPPQDASFDAAAIEAQVAPAVVAPPPQVAPVAPSPPAPRAWAPPPQVAPAAPPAPVAAPASAPAPAAPKAAPWKRK